VGAAATLRNSFSLAWPDTAQRPVRAGLRSAGTRGADDTTRPSGPYLELFARETKQGWDCWGNQARLFDQGTVATRRQPCRLVGETPLLL
jgi:hypothetical protein